MQHKKRYSVNVEVRGKFWQARVYLEGEGGHSRRFATGVAVGDRWRESKREATAVAEQRAALLAAQEVATVAAEDDTSLGAVAERMLRQKTANRRRRRAVDALAGNLDKHVLPFFKKTRDVTTIRRRDLEAFKVALSEKGYAPTTINNVLTAIRQTLKFACEVEERIDSVPVVKNVEVDKRSKGMVLSPAQASKFLASFESTKGSSKRSKRAPTEEREFNLFLLNTGLRKTEALAILWAWVDLAEREINIPGEYRKGGKPQKAPTQINDVVFALLIKRKSRKDQPSKGRVWWQIGTLDDARRAAAAKAGIAGYRHHDARHTRATHLGAAGATATDLRDQMGWSTLAMINRYTHPDRARLKEMAARVQFGGSSKSPSPATSHPSRKRAKR